MAEHNSDDKSHRHHAERADHAQPKAAKRQLLGPHRARRWRPFQQMASGDEQAPECAHDRVRHHERLVGKERDVQGRQNQRKLKVRTERAGVAGDRDAGAAREKSRDRGYQVGNQHRRQHQPCPGERGGERLGPAKHQGQHGGRGGQGSPEIVDHLPAADERERIAPPCGVGAFARKAQNPRQQLPVPARPAVMSRRADVVTRRKFFDDLDVGRKPRAGERALEQIVA